MPSKKAEHIVDAEASCNSPVYTVPLRPPLVQQGEQNNQPMQEDVVTDGTAAPTQPHPPRGGGVRATQHSIPPLRTTQVAGNVPTLTTLTVKKGAASSVAIAPAMNKLKKLSKAAEVKLESVARESVEYVQGMLHIGSMDVASVRILRNEAVDTPFAVAVPGVPGEHKMIKVLHGTSIDAIMREGFKAERKYAPAMGLPMGNASTSIIAVQ